MMFFFLLCVAMILFSTFAFTPIPSPIYHTDLTLRYYFDHPRYTITRAFPCL